MADASTSTGEDADFVDGSGGPPSSIYALALGHSWRWHFVSAARLDCELVGTITGTIDVEGRHAFIQSFASSSCSGFADVYLAVDADDRLELRTSNPAPWVHQDPPSEGHTWDRGDGLLFTWHATASITVPAGTFSDCWTATAMPIGGGTTQVTYCRGVGLVDQEATSAMGFAFFERLLSKSF